MRAVDCVQDSSGVDWGKEKNGSVGNPIRSVKNPTPRAPRKILGVHIERGDKIWEYNSEDKSFHLQIDVIELYLYNHHHHQQLIVFLLNDLLYLQFEKCK